MRHHFLHLILSSLLCFFLVRSADSQSSKVSNGVAHYLRNPPNPGYIVRNKSGLSYFVYSPVDEYGTNTSDQHYLWWVNESWGKSDKVYAKSKHDIDLQIKRGTKTLVLAKRFKKEYESNRVSSLTTYKLAYVCWLIREQVSKSQRDSLMKSMGDHLSQVRFPRSYHFARLSFLIHSYNRPVHALMHVGQDLLHACPQDEEVKYALISILISGTVKITDVGLSSTYSKIDDSRALSYLNYFRKKYPIKPQYDLKYAQVLSAFWGRQKPLTAKKANDAIAAYNSYLKKYPKSNDKQQILYEIGYIKSRQRGWKIYEEEAWKQEQAEARRKYKDYLDRERKRHEYNAKVRAASKR